MTMMNGLAQDDVKNGLEQVIHITMNGLAQDDVKNGLVQVIHLTIESDKTTSIYNVSTRVLSKK